MPRMKDTMNKKTTPLQNRLPRNDSACNIRAEFKKKRNAENFLNNSFGTDSRRHGPLSSIQKCSNNGTDTVSSVKESKPNYFMKESSTSHHSNQEQGIGNKSYSEFGFFSFDLDVEETENNPTMKLPDASLFEKDMMNESKPWSECSQVPVQKKFARSLSVPEDCIISGVPSITDLDKIQREKRESAERKDAFESESHINGALRKARALLEDNLAMDSDIGLNNGRSGPRLRIRPQPMQTMLIHGVDKHPSKPTATSSPILISNSNMLHSNPEGYDNSFPHLFPSPNSDRFVLHFPDETKDSNNSLDLLEHTWPSLHNAPAHETLRDQIEDDNSLLITSNHHLEANRDETSSTTSRSSSLSTGSPTKRNLPSVKPEVIRKQPIRLKPKITSKQQDLTRKKSASSLSSSSLEDLDLPVYDRCCNKVDIIHPKPRLGSKATVGDKSPSNSSMKEGTTFPLPLAAHTALRSNGPFTHFQISSDPSGGLPAPNSGSSDVSSSSAFSHNRNGPTSSLDSNLMEQRFSSDIHTNNSDFTNDPHTTTTHNMYASPNDTNDHEQMSSPPQMEPKKIENQILLAKEAALRFSSHNKHRSMSIGMSSLDPPTPPILQDCDYTTPQSRLEKPAFYSNNLGGKGDKTSRKNLFLPRLSSFSGKSEDTLEMDIDNSCPDTGFIYNNLSGTKISES